MHWRNSTLKGHRVWQHGPELASSKELLRPSYTYQELCPYLPCPGIECSKVQVFHTNVQRPVILHAYGGAKVHMESALQTLRLQGWIPMASALVGTDTRPPLWVTNDLRVTAGTSIDLTLRPHPLTQKERLAALIAVAKALACSQGYVHLALGSRVLTRSLDLTMRKAHTS